MKSSKVKVFVVGFCCLFLFACSSGFKQDDLVGRWNYIFYDYLNKSQDHSPIDLSLQKPYIEFAKDGKCKIISSAKLLSEGNYHLENKIIRYTENLADGQKREIPFLIKSLTAKELVFQTMDNEVIVIKAVKN